MQKRNRATNTSDKKQATEAKQKTLLLKSATLLGVMVVAILLALSPWGHHIDLFYYDVLQLISGTKKPHEQVVIVAIDEPSFAVLQRQWPWPRGEHARLIDTLFSNGARTVAFDILFAEPSDTIQDQLIEKSVKAHPDTILSAAIDLIDESGYQQQSIVMPAKTVANEKSKVGILNLPVDQDGFVRRASIQYGDIPGLALAAVQSFTSRNKDIIPRFPSSDELLINYAGPPRSIPTVSYYQAMAPSSHLPQHFFKDKLVFVGLSLQASPNLMSPSPDHFPFPYARWGSAPIPGVEIHATIASNLLIGNFIKLLPWQMALTVFVWCAGFYTMVFLRNTLSIVLTVILLAGSLLTTYALFAWGHLYYPITLPLLPVTVGFLATPFPHLFRLRKEKQLIRNIFSRYVSPNLVGQLLENPNQLKLGGKLVDATVLYLDIAGFTTMAARMEPEALVAILSRYMGRFSDTIFHWEGMVDKYIGDAIMAIWGAPLPVSNHPERAGQAALAIIQDLKDLQKSEADPIEMPVDIRIGINSGTMLAGNVGGKRFLDYTVHGEATNLAVRLEAINKIYKTHILLGQETASRLGGDFITRKIDNIRLLGQSTPVGIYELLGLTSRVDSQLRQQCRLFEKARRLYLKKNFAAAQNLFSRILSIARSDGPSQVYLDRCKQYMETPPGPSWDGITEIQVK